MADEGPVPLSIIPETVVDVGGDLTNELVVGSMVDLNDSPRYKEVFAKQTGREITEENSFSAVATIRFFDAVTSRELDEALVGYSTVVMTTVIDDPGDLASQAHHYIADRSGIRQRDDIIPFDETQSVATALDQVILPREARVTAYSSHLVGYNDDGTKVYLAASFEEPTSEVQGRSEYYGIQGVEYQRVEFSGEILNSPPDAPGGQSRDSRETSPADSGGLATYRAGLATGADVAGGCEPNVPSCATTGSSTSGISAPLGDACRALCKLAGATAAGASFAGFKKCLAAAAATGGFLGLGAIAGTILCVLVFVAIWIVIGLATNKCVEDCPP